MTSTAGTSHPLKFYHPSVGSFTINLGMNDIEWGYELNTVNFPTYGGEVIQILSCFIDNVTLSGTFQTYVQMEQFYSYFFRYLEQAAQGASGPTDPGQNSYNQQPMTMEYPHRSWSFKIIPLEVPGFRYGREIVAPEWSMSAFVLDPSEELKSEVISEIEIRRAIGDVKSDANFGLQGKIGLVNPPFSDPFTEEKGKFDPTDSKNLTQLGDYFSKLIPSYLEGDFEALLGNVGSKPAFGDTTAPRGTSSQDAADQTATQTQRAGSR
jgi:hypothetical protein